MKFDSLIFDLDGTLWNSADTVAEAWNIALEKAGYDVRITGEDVLKQMGKPMDAIMRDAFGETMSQEEAMAFLKVLSDEEINHIEKTGGKLMPMLTETLDELKKAGFDVEFAQGYELKAKKAKKNQPKGGRMK